MNKKKIAVGMSGGVDSSVSALLLKQAGYDVIGITMLLKPEFITKNEVNPLKEAEDAKAVCDKIGIKHYVADFRDYFTEKVIDNFVGEYLNGRTPNPCVVCNFNLKFGKMLDFALELGCDAIATGHYACIEEKDNQFYLKRADSPKDQSYFLYTMNQYQLSHTVFPLIFREKSETREIAAEFGLPVAFKSDSQDICFVKDGKYIDLIENYANVKSNTGHFVNQNGDILGEHKGVYRYTVGQRKGLGIALGERAFVTEIDTENNNVVLGTKEDGMTKVAFVNNPHFINLEKLEKEKSVFVKTRYRAKPVLATISQCENKLKIVFDEEQSFVCPGQSAVFYDGDTVVGGGILE